MAAFAEFERRCVLFWMSFNGDFEQINSLGEQRSAMAQRETWAPRNRVAIGYLVSSTAVDLPTIEFTAAQLAGAFSVIVTTDPIT